MSTATGATEERSTGRRSRARLVALLAVVGPGLLAGLSDDDPPGITTYSVLGTEYGYQLLWVLLLSTVALVVFHSLGARMGVVTGQGLIGLVRDRYGPRRGGAAMVLLLVANLGTTCAELAGVAAGFVVHPDWGAAATGLITPSMPLTSDAIVIVTATVGTTLAPWGLSFIQSYAVDKKLTVDDLRYERVDVVIGSVLTGVIGFFVVVTCAATLHAQDVSIESATDAAAALEPLAGSFATSLFGLGLIGAAVLAAAVLPLSTAYSVCEFTGHEGALDDGFRRAPVFYGTYLGVAAVALVVVLLPGLSLVPLLVLTQVLNAVLLLPLLLFMYGLSRDPELMAGHQVRGGWAAVYVATICLVATCIAALFVLTLL